MVVKMSDIELFQTKNPKASDEYCDLAATLYELLWRQDAFESGVQVENFHTSFRFLFPNGKILIASKTLHHGGASVPCYICDINGFPHCFFCFSFNQIYSWLQDNLKYLIDDDKK